jgi:hypothetical protein
LIKGTGKRPITNIPIKAMIIASFAGNGLGSLAEVRESLMYMNLITFDIIKHRQDAVYHARYGKHVIFRLDRGCKDHEFPEKPGQGRYAGQESRKSARQKARAGSRLESPEYSSMQSLLMELDTSMTHPKAPMFIRT